MRKFIEIFHIYSEREIENIFAYVYNKKEPHPNTPSSDRLWFIGKKLWGLAFIDLEYKIREGIE